MLPSVLTSPFGKMCTVPASSRSTMVRRFTTPVGADHLRYEVTIEDPKVFTRRWKMSMPPR